MATIEQLDGAPEQAEAATEEILREYLLWIAERLESDYGVVFDDLDAVYSAHQQEFAHELPRLLGPQGRLVVARDDDGIVGTGALKPVDAAVAEIKRMYVHPRARGQGLGRAILERLLDDARTIGYQVARLETVGFMTEAQALYRSLGFQDRPIFENTEASMSGLESVMLFMELRLDHALV